jgi:hypothetical protein
MTDGPWYTDLSLIKLFFFVYFTSDSNRRHISDGCLGHARIGPGPQAPLLEDGGRVRQPRAGDVGDDLCPQRGADILDTAVLPVGISGGAEREENEVFVAAGEVVHLGRRHGGDDVELDGDLSAVCIQGEIVDILAKGVLDFAADSGKSEDDVCGNCAS